MGWHPRHHIRHGSRVGHPLSGLVEDWARKTRVGRRLGQISSLLGTVVVVASHLVVLRHRCLVRERLFMVGLGHVLGNPELLDIFIVTRQVLGDGHLFLAVHVAAGHTHAFT